MSRFRVHSVQEPPEHPGAPQRIPLGETLRAALCALVLAALAVGRPVWDASVVYVAADHAAVQLPWSAALDEPPDAPRHPDLSDEALAFYPAWRHVAQRLAAGDVPLWNPDVQAGVPCLANPQWGVLDPEIWALAACEKLGGKELFDRGLAWLAVLRLAAALLGAYLLARRLGLGAFGAAFAAVGFGGSGFVLGWLGFSLGHVAPTLPWLLFCIEGVSGPRPRRNVLGVAAFAWLAIVGGHPETSFFVGAAGGLWAARLFLADRTAGLRAFAGLACGALLAAPLWVPFYEYLQRSGALVAHQLARGEVVAPSLVSAGLLTALVGLVWIARARFSSLRRWEAVFFAISFSLPFLVVLRLLFVVEGVRWTAPLFGAGLYGGPGSGSAYRGASSFLEFSALSLAAPVAVLAFAEMLSPAGRLRRRNDVFVIGLGAWVLAAGLPTACALWSFLPLVGDAATSRAAVVAALLLALAAGEALERWLPSPRRAAALALAGAAALLLALDTGSADRYADLGFDPDDELVVFSERPDADPAHGRLPLAGVLNAAVPAVAARVALESVLAHDSDQIQRLEVPIALTPIPGGGTAFRCEHLETARIPEGPWSLVFEILGTDANGQSEVIGHRRVGRIVIERAPDLRNPTGLFLGLALLLALLPLPERPARAALFALLLVQVGRYAWFAHPAVPHAEVFPPTRTTDVLARELGVGRVLGGPGVLLYNTPLAHGLRTLDGYDALNVDSFDGYRAFALKPGTNPLLDWNAHGVDLDAPAFRLLGATHLATAEPLEHPRYALVASPADGAETYVYADSEPYPRAFCVPRVVPREEVLRDPRGFDALAAAFLEPGVTWQPDAPFSTAEVDDLVLDGDEARVTVSLDGEGLLVLCEQAFPGWVATVDGEERPIWTVNTLFRGVALEAGTHEVVFRYRPGSLRLGAWLALAGLVGLALLLRSSGAPRPAAPDSPSSGGA